MSGHRVGPSVALARTWLRRNVVATIVLTLVVALASGAATGAFAATAFVLVGVGANLVAIVPGRSARRLRPADALRSE